MERGHAVAPDADRTARRRPDRLGLRDRGPPLIAYLDTSALIKLLVDEDETRETQQAVRAATAVATSAVSYVEARAAFARMRANGRVGEREHRTSRRHLDELWLDILAVMVDDELLASAADLADKHSLRGYDSVQLAAAASLTPAGPVGFACWDAELNAAARDLGLAVLTPVG